MEITIDNFKGMYQKSLWAAKLFMIERARSVVVQQYCRKLTVRGACTGECKICGLHIQSSLQWMTDHDIPKMSYPIFGKVMKTAFANRLDEVLKQKPASKPETNFLGEATERNPFDVFAETLNG